jgi:hypothetical protein
VVLSHDKTVTSAKLMSRWSTSWCAAQAVKGNRQATIVQESRLNSTIACDSVHETPWPNGHVPVPPTDHRWRAFCLAPSAAAVDSGGER